MIDKGSGSSLLLALVFAGGNTVARSDESETMRSTA